MSYRRIHTDFSISFLIQRFLLSEISDPAMPAWELSESCHYFPDLRKTDGLQCLKKFDIFSRLMQSEL